MSTDWWLPVLTFVGGSGITLAVEYLRTLTAREDRRQEALDHREDREAERSARERERSLQLEDEHRVDQRYALTELQEKLSDYLRASGDASHEYHMAWVAAGRPDHYPVGSLEASLNEKLNTLQRRVQILAERIDDDQVRTGVNEFVRLVNGSLMATDPDKAFRLGGQVAKNFGKINMRIGEVLRFLTVHRGRLQVRE